MITRSTCSGKVLNDEIKANFARDINSKKMVKLVSLNYLTNLLIEPLMTVCYIQLIKLMEKSVTIRELNHALGVNMLRSIMRSTMYQKPPFC